MPWDRAELARMLAEREADAEDLVEAFPAIRTAATMEAEMLPEYIEQNWRQILHDYDIRDLDWWMEEKREDERWNRWYDEILEEENAYAEYRNDEYERAILDLMLSFRDCTDLVEKKKS